MGSDLTRVGWIRIVSSYYIPLSLKVTGGSLQPKPTARNSGLGPAREALTYMGLCQVLSRLPFQHWAQTGLASSVRCFLTYYKLFNVQIPNS
jgi:hypothetical protein